VSDANPQKSENVCEVCGRPAELHITKVEKWQASVRRECGTNVSREKAIEYARRLLGHANISTTQRYLHLDDRELADAQDLGE
jgi:hypothetical protein